MAAGRQRLVIQHCALGAKTQAAFGKPAHRQWINQVFLLVYAAISVGHLRIRQQTGARAWVLVLAVLVNAVLFTALLLRAIATGSTATVLTLPALLVAAVLFQTWWHRRHRHTAGAV